MPRDLTEYKNEKPADSMPELTKSPEETEERAPGGIEYEQSMIDDMSQRNEKRDELHPYTQTLKLSDIDACVRLEEETFPPQERCTREKFQYRLSKCGELSLGIFTSHSEGTIATAEHSAPVYSGAPDRKAVLLGHIVATKTTYPSVTDDDMNVPSADAPDPNLGHKEEGRTVCIHSLAVLPEYQNRGLGKTLVKAYLQRIESSGVGDRVALIAHEALIPYYEQLGFENRGKSAAQFAGGGWIDMVQELKPEHELTMEDMA